MIFDSCCTVEQIDFMYNELIKFLDPSFSIPELIAQLQAHKSESYLRFKGGEHYAMHKTSKDYIWFDDDRTSLIKELKFYMQYNEIINQFVEDILCQFHFKRCITNKQYECLKKYYKVWGVENFHYQENGV